MFDRLVESGQFGGSTDAETETNFVTVSDEDTIDISHVSLSSSCSQKQVFLTFLLQSWENWDILTAGNADTDVGCSQASQDQPMRLVVVGGGGSQSYLGT